MPRHYGEISMNDQTLVVQSMKVSTHGFASLAVPTYRASTIVFDSAEEYRNRGKRAPDGYSYGLYGTPTTRELEQKLTALENGVRTFLTPSGQASNAFALLALLSAGDRLLMADNVYPATRDFADRDLRKFGIDTIFFDPTSPEDLAGKLRDGAKMVWCEQPGSTTMEVTDLPRLAELSHAAGALVGCDNTWATPLNLKPLDLGADIVTEALTKYVAGHSDVFMGSITVRDEKFVETMRSTLGRYGIGASPDDASLVLRGMETLAVRLSYSSRVATDIASWLASQPLVEAVLFPPLPQSPGHTLWKRDFRGASGVFSVIFRRGMAARVPQALDTLRIFSIGASWGGTRSLVAPMPVIQHRSVTPWPHDDLVLRFSIGLEAEQDLHADVERLLQRLSADPL
ncbi:cystathionine beta-lyase [Bradyrhizobium sp. AZCC 1577]